MLSGRGGGTSSSNLTRWLRTVPQCRMSRASILLLVLVALTLSWTVTVWRTDPTSPRLHASLPCTPVTGADCTCPTQVLQAIEQLERLKTEVHSSVITAPVTPAAPAPLVPATSGDSGKPFLLIAIPSMPRAADYLTSVLDALDSQLVHEADDPMYGSIHVWVMNNAPVGTAHPVFDSNRARFEGRSEFRFLTNDHSLTDPPGAPQGEHSGTPDMPGARVRKQTRDIARLMQLAAGQSRYYLAMEDDFIVCPHALRIVEHSLRKASRGRLSLTAPPPPPSLLQLQQDWITIKIGYGFNGLMLHNNQDLQQFATYLLQHQTRRPPVRETAAQ